MTIFGIIAGIITIGLFVFFVLYVTYLFVHRLRQGKGVTKSFLSWLRDLFDAACGLG
jgi:hypothetical protein